MKYLLDMNTCIFLINRESEAVRRKMRTVAVGEIGVSSVTVSELEYGVAKSQAPRKNRMALDQFLLPLEILQYDESAARHYGVVRAELERKGTPIGSMDTMIAAHALSQNLIVVTNNSREFARVPGLRVEDWTAG
ncbi:MAG: type II toxin-antitoxin system VapC family toxin [Puniceicoccaceae bacterium]